MAEIVQLLRSGVHRYDGRPGAGITLPDGELVDGELVDGELVDGELVDALELRAGLGVVGDRYFNRPAHRDASVTVMAAESLAAWPGTDLRQTRRNVLLRGLDVDGTGRLDGAGDPAGAGNPAGRVLSLDSGDGPVLLHLRRRAHPCAWLDATIAPGAWKALRGHGGMRCTPLTDGVLRVGPVAVEWLDPATVPAAASAVRG